MLKFKFYISRTLCIVRLDNVYQGTEIYWYHSRNYSDINFSKSAIINSLFKYQNVAVQLSQQDILTITIIMSTGILL